MCIECSIFCVAFDIAFKVQAIGYELETDI